MPFRYFIALMQHQRVGEFPLRIDMVWVDLLHLTESVYCVIKPSLGF
ncbi:MAG: hypothetical protein [Olavius algarvensis Gamma 1 endosymbiont]|nr:MAG: hypothetical protein [Olavius algarvensis Gamma 1 endosymbiont]